MNTIKILCLVALFMTAQKIFTKAPHPRMLVPQRLTPTRELPMLKNNDGKKRAIIIGASSGMGNALAKKLLDNGYLVGVTARRLEPLQELQKKYGINVFVQQMDISKPKESVTVLNTLINAMNGMDLCVIAATGYNDADQEARAWDFNNPILAVDVLGFSALARTAINFFELQNAGHLVGFSSVDGYQGRAGCPDYSAAKAYITRFLEAERNRCMQLNLPITVTELAPGWVSVSPEYEAVLAKLPAAYWVESLDDATTSIYKAIQDKTPVAYVTERWGKVVDLFKVIPNDLYNALSARPGGTL